MRVKSSTLFKIGFTGGGIFVAAALAPLLMAIFGYPKFSEHLGVALNEKFLSIFLVGFSAIIYFGIMKKREETMLAHIEKQREEKH